mmetsp:Transcript_12155/g.48878  ORF Transcript_12155/g.48878 Transcript_12155/m.48878 type:complete len:268 (-) Transcript_12155:843-1646(-)
MATPACFCSAAASSCFLAGLSSFSTAALVSFRSRRLTTTNVEALCSVSASILPLSFAARAGARPAAGPLSRRRRRRSARVANICCRNGSSSAPSSAPATSAIASTTPLTSVVRSSSGIERNSTTTAWPYWQRRRSPTFSSMYLASGSTTCFSSSFLRTSGSFLLVQTSSPSGPGTKVGWSAATAEGGKCLEEAGAKRWSHARRPCFSPRRRAMCSIISESTALRRRTVSSVTSRSLTTTRCPYSSRQTLWTSPFIARIITFLSFALA